MATALKITFEAPITIGDLQHQTSIASLEIITISFNLAPFSGHGKANVSVTLRDPASGYQAHYLYEDNDVTRSFWEQVADLQLDGEPWLKQLLTRLIGDGKLPAGTVSA